MGSGATASALFYTLVETAKSNGLEPYKYMRYLLENITDDDKCRKHCDWRDSTGWPPKNGDKSNKQR